MRSNMYSKRNKGRLLHLIIHPSVKDKPQKEKKFSGSRLHVMIFDVNCSPPGCAVVQGNMVMSVFKEIPIFILFSENRVSSSWHHDFWHLPGFLVLRTIPHPSLSFCVHTDTLLLGVKKSMLCFLHTCTQTHRYTHISQLNRKWRQWWNLGVMFRAKESNRTDKRQSPHQKQTGIPV